LQDTYKTETTSALQTLKADHDTATSTCNQLTQQLAKQQTDHTAELASLQDTHAAAHKEQQVIAEGLRQQLEAAQARAATAEEQLAASKAAAEEDAATITKLQANITGVCSAGKCGSAVIDISWHQLSAVLCRHGVLHLCCKNQIACMPCVANPATYACC
jgi:septal ring factor EnvC (AmiA/AmiB activator)